LGRKPFSKEPALDYEVDSEAEWEEGDDDPGEDVDNDAGDEEEDKDEEGDPRMYNYQDGWLAEDDDLLGDEDELDEEAKKLLRSRKRAEGSGFVPVCIIAPADGGVPVPDRYADCNDPAAHGKVEGFSVQQAYKLAAAHDGEILADADICLDPFPPALVDEKDGPSTNASQNNEPTKEDLKTIARFVHHSNLGSKDKVIEELRTAHSSVTSSRAQGYRVLDSIAEKKRNPKVKNGVYWEVKQDVIESLGLEDLKVSYFLVCCFVL
jgi:hypothetical protein